MQYSVSEAALSLNLCALCPRDCRVDRAAGTRGPCGLANEPLLAAADVRFREERCISGTRGSGMVFLSGCTHACVFCQNYDINLQFKGRKSSVAELADAMLRFQDEHRAHNVHWVSPTQQVPWLLEALANAKERGLALPLVYNTGGWESVEVLRELDGIVDVYLPDFKFWDDALSWKYVRVPRYAEITRAAILEMKRQVGDLVLDRDGIAQRGLMVRHLVMPDLLEDSGKIFDWIASALGPQTYVNVMHQYEPLYRASRHPAIARKTRTDEWRAAMRRARAAGLRRLYRYQEVEESEQPRVPVDCLRR